MKKKLLVLPCIAAVAIATIAGTKGWNPNVSKSSNLLLANVEALAKDEATPNQEKKLTTEVIDIDRAELVDTVYFSKFLNSPQIIKLETNKKCVIQEIYRLDVFEGKFYILDVKSNSLFVFDSKGRYIYNIGERGNGNKEYLQISDFSIDRQNKIVYIWDEGRGRALSFDTETGKYLSMINHGVNESQCYDMLFTKGKLYT